MEIKPCFIYVTDIIIIKTGVPLKYLILFLLILLLLINCDSTGPSSIFTPFIKISGEDTLTLINPSYFTEPGYSCIDTEDGDITNSVKVLWFHSDQITLFNEDSVKQDSLACIRYSIEDSDGLTHIRWRYLKFTGPFNEDLPWITLVDTQNVSIYNSSYYKEQGYNCLGFNNSELKDSVIVTWYRKDKVTPYNIDSAKIDSLAYLKYSITINDSLHDEKWRLVTFTGPFPEDLYIPDPSAFTGCIKPNNVSQTSMDSTLYDVYQYWKEEYVTASGSTENGYYVSSNGGTGATEGALTVSEAHGFGMLITALMSKFDSTNSKTIFDGMYKFYKDHPCSDNSLLMAWEVLGDGAGGELSSKEAGSYSNTSATDGDIDIAYALLLAHTVWGSDGDINYLSTADSLINYAIKGEEVGDLTKRPLLGSWDNQSQYQTRPSDWMTGEFHSFAELTGETFWNDVVDTIYSIADHIVTNYSLNIGLVPDFVIKEIPEPATPHFLEFKYDGEYYNNACRVPMRIMTDVAHHNDEDAIKWMMIMARWITSKSNNNPENIVGGYFLKYGEEIRDWGFPAFTSPFIVSATISADYQDFVNSGWNYMKDIKWDYYNDCINLMCMLQVSGNWWKPELQS